MPVPAPDRVVRCICFLAVLAAAAPLSAAELRVGRVTHVIDGESLEVLMGARRLRVRLAGIEAAPEGHAFGLRARQSLVQICGGEVATIETHTRNAKGVAVARVTCSGTDAGAEQVRRGFARVSDRDAPALVAIESQARAAHRGLWSVPSAARAR